MNSNGFDWNSRTRLVFGAGSVERVGEFVKGRVLLVTDPGIVRAGHAERVRRLIESSGAPVTMYPEARENPTTEDVDRCVEVARRDKVEMIVGLGGGSSMDTAKGTNFILTNGGRMQDYWGTGKATKPMLPLIAIPTTAGTGSECQSYALIADAVTHQKMACGDPKASAVVAILDPVLTLTQPRTVAACTGMDAIAHAVETAVTKRANRLSEMLSREAYRLLSASFPVVLSDPDNLAAREAMQLGAALAGMAIETSMLGAAHAAANPLTAHVGIIHGQAVGLMLPHVVRFNMQDSVARARYDEMDAHLPERLEDLLQRAGLPRRLSECGVNRELIPTLAGEAARQWTATFNPRIVQAPDFVQLYEAAF